MRKLTIVNAFSVNMLAQSDMVKVLFVRVEDPANLLEALSREFEVVSAVGHGDTATLFTSILNREVPVNRMTVTLQGQDELLLGQYSGPRLPEGATELPQGARIDWFAVQLG